MNKIQNIDNNKRFYILSLVVLTALSSYPLFNGVRMAYISITVGALEPEQYAKYVVPYAAICVSLLFFAALQPVFQKLKRLSFLVGIVMAYGIFFAVERVFEKMQIHVSGMTLIDTATLSPNVANAADPDLTVDLWQAALCMVSPDMGKLPPPSASPDALIPSLTYASQDTFIYVLDDNTYKVHYYLISIIMIIMICGLVFGIARMIRNKDMTAMKPLFLQGASTTALIALCVFANTTAFFRQAAPIQTPLASVLTGSFFVILGAAAGIYVGNLLLRRRKFPGIGIPVLLSLCVTILMYAGEAIMMRGNLYCFGTGWFFGELSGIVLAPVDILIVLLSGAG